MTVEKHRYTGEEAEAISWQDERAARELAAKMLAGQIDPMSIMVQPPTRRPVAVVKGRK